MSTEGSPSENSEMERAVSAQIRNAANAPPTSPCKNPVPNPERIVAPPPARRAARRPATRVPTLPLRAATRSRSEEHTSELQSRQYLVCRLLLEKKKQTIPIDAY